MEFLKELAIPQSLEHFHLVVFFIALSSVVFVPYVGFVLGSSILSLWYNRKGRASGNLIYLQFAYEIINTALNSKKLIVFLAVFPGFTLVLSYAQILQTTSSLGVGFAGFGYLFLIAALILLYSYKFTFRLQSILGAYRDLVKHQDGIRVEDIAKIQEDNTRAHIHSGGYGILCLCIACILFSGAISIVVNPSLWDINTFLYMVVSLDSWISLFEILAITVGVTGVGILFFTFAWEAEKKYSEEYSSLVMKVGLRLSVFGLLLLPLMILLKAAFLPDAANIGMVYTMMSIAVVGFFIVAHFIYGYYRSRESSALAPAFLIFIFSSAMGIIGDTIALGTATRSQAVIFASKYNRHIDELKAKYGGVAVAFTGEDIYNAKCSACHLFDQKKVGPPYYESIPKYEGRKADLINFVLNPVKKDPAYPPMPSQGLKSAEADSIVSYILRKIQMDRLQIK
jgi:cytochrome c551/c552